MKRQVFVMQGIDSVQGKVSDKTLAKADGIVIRTKWSSFETLNDDYRFKYLVAEIGRAQKLKKDIHLQVLAGIHSPTWLKQLGCKYAGKSPLPWDAVYQAEYSAMVYNLTRIFDSNDLITHFHAPGHGNSEWNYKDTGVYTHKEYTDAKMVKAHVDFVQILAGKLPHTIIVCDLLDHDKKWTGEAIKQMKAQFKGRVGFQMNSLSAKTSTTFAGYTRIRDAAKEGHHAGFEMLCTSGESRFGGKYETAIAKANATAAQWQCIYQSDCDRVQQ